jgi:hypothetical protein
VTCEPTFAETDFPDIALPIAANRIKIGEDALPQLYRSDIDPNRSTSLINRILIETARKNVRSERLLRIKQRSATAFLDHEVFHKRDHDRYSPEAQPIPVTTQEEKLQN